MSWAVLQQKVGEQWSALTDEQRHQARKILVSLQAEQNERYRLAVLLSFAAFCNNWPTPDEERGS